MKLRTVLTLVLLLFVPLIGSAAKKRQPFSLEISPSSSGMPLVTLTASGVPLNDVAERLAKKLGTTIDVSAAARSFPVTTELDRQPLDLTLREVAPQAYVDGILTGGNDQVKILAIHLRMAGEPAPPLAELQKRSTETVMFFGNTEDPGVDPFEGQLAVTVRNGSLRVLAKRQPVSVVVARIADALGIPFELVGDASEVIDVSVADASVEQLMRALTPAVQLYFRKDLATLKTTPVRIVVQEPFPASDGKP